MAKLSGIRTLQASCQEGEGGASALGVKKGFEALQALEAPLQALEALEAPQAPEAPFSLFLEAFEAPFTYPSSSPSSLPAFEDPCFSLSLPFEGKV